MFRKPSEQTTVEGSEAGNEGRHAEQKEVGVQQEGDPFLGQKLEHDVQAEQEHAAIQGELESITGAHRFQFVLLFSLTTGSLERNTRKG